MKIVLQLRGDISSNLKLIEPTLPIVPSPGSTAELSAHHLDRHRRAAHTYVELRRVAVGARSMEAADHPVPIGQRSSPAMGRPHQARLAR